LLEGIKILEIPKNIDERGYFAEIFREDWKEKLFGKDHIVQGNLSVSYPGMIRAWHRHALGQVDYFLVLKGSIKICAYDDATRELNQIISSGERLQIVRIPGFYWHGFKNIGDKTAMVIYFVNNLYNHSAPDEERRPWNDEFIFDKRVGAKFDWDSPPHR
jgi:dTDP-4-dehydrorhamnose 3,5-epimerase